MITRALAVFCAVFVALHLGGLVALDAHPGWLVFKQDLSNRNMYLVAGGITLLLLTMDMIFAFPSNKSPSSRIGRFPARGAIDLSSKGPQAAASEGAKHVSQVPPQFKAAPDTEVDQSWINHAYPLQQIVIKVQGTRHSDTQSLLTQLDKAVERIKAGALVGAEHDDDFGYQFEVVRESPGPSLFDEGSGRS